MEAVIVVCMQQYLGNRTVDLHNLFFKLKKKKEQLLFMCCK